MCLVSLNKYCPVTGWESASSASHTTHSAAHRKLAAFTCTWLRIDWASECADWESYRQNTARCVQCGACALLAGGWLAVLCCGAGWLAGRVGAGIVVCSILCLLFLLAIHCQGIARCTLTHSLSEAAAHCFVAGSLVQYTTLVSQAASAAQQSGSSSIANHIQHHKNFNSFNSAEMNALLARSMLIP